MIPVFCLTCGAELRRKPARRGGKETWPCYTWYDLTGARADRCPQCGAITSALSTAPAPDVATIGRLARALHFLCAAVRCNYMPGTIRTAGYLDAGLAALRAAGWDPDRPRPWAEDPAGAPDLAAAVACERLYGQLAPLPPAARAAILELLDQAVTSATRSEGPAGNG